MAAKKQSPETAAEATRPAVPVVHKSAYKVLIAREIGGAYRKEGEVIELYAKQATYYLPPYAAALQLDEAATAKLKAVAEEAAKPKS